MNVVKFIDFGLIDVIVLVEKDDVEWLIFWFLVKDIGIGILYDKYEVLFGDFVIVDSSYIKK